MSLLKLKSHWIYYLFFLLLGGIFIFYLNQHQSRLAQKAQRVVLENQHTRVLNKFENSIDKFAGLTAGMRSYMNLSETLPTAEEFQYFVKNQFQDINSQDSIVVSFIDTAHVFKQSFTRNAMNPANLVGRTVYSLRKEGKINKLNNLMDSDSLRLFPPINLVEGWVGLPINFRVKRQDTVIGYVAAIVDFKSVINAIYTDAGANNFLFHFSTEENFDFDRARAHNNTKVYNTAEDPFYYKNFATDETDFLYSTARFYGFNFKIGTAYKYPKTLESGVSWTFLFWYLTFALLAAVVTLQIDKAKRLNLKLQRTNKEVILQERTVKTKNIELQRLTNTQHKFFSIIGHDIKQPLNAIDGLIYLLEDEEINDPGLVGIIKGLKKSTRNTVGLLDNLLRWAMSQTGEIKFKNTTFDIHKNFQEVIGSLNQAAKEKEIRIQHSLDGGIMFSGDQDMIQTTLRNLLSNAIKFSRQGGEIFLEIKKLDQAIHIIIRDNGVGMEPEMVANLFELDFGHSREGTRRETGTGLGLVLCNDFVKRHNGYIEVESIVNKGATFTVVLPLDT